VILSLKPLNWIVNHWSICQRLGLNLYPRQHRNRFKVVELYPGRENAQKRADVLNQAGVPCGKGNAPWDAKKVMDNYRNALKRQGQPTLI